jgi:glycosyltransferase involved in cell wall biosynthesis
MRTSLDIIVVNDYAHVRGGGDRVALASAIGLSDAGHRVTFFCAVAPVDPVLAGHPGVRVVCLGLPDILGDTSRLRAARSGTWNRGASAAFRKVVRRLDPGRTLVHVHSYTKALSASVPYASAKLGFHTVLSLHDYFLFCPNGAFFEYPAMQVCGRAPLGLDCLKCRCDARSHSHKLWRFARTWWQNRVAALPCKLSCAIAVSGANLEVARRHLPARTSLELVPYPVDAEYREPVEVEKNDTFLFVGRMELYKGPQLFAAAAARLGANAVFCGEGPAMARVREICPQALLAGWQDRKALPGHFAAARALVFPSLWPETFGLTAAEALARGVPVVVSSGTAASDLIEHGSNGLVFRRGSVESLAECLRRLGDPELARRLGREAHRRYWTHPLTLRRHVARLEEVYASVLSAPRLAA